MLELGYTVLGDFSKLSGNETDAPSTRLTKWNEIHCTCWIWSNQYKVLNLFLFSLNSSSQKDRENGKDERKKSKSTNGLDRTSQSPSSKISSQVSFRSVNDFELEIKKVPQLWFNFCERF
jgi:hypothetical protein